MQGSRKVLKIDKVEKESGKVLPVKYLSPVASS